MKRMGSILLIVAATIWACGCSRDTLTTRPPHGGDPSPTASAGLQIDWGAVPEYFALDDVRSEPRRMVDSNTGEVVEFNGVVFTGVARQTMYTPLISVDYCDQEGVKLRSGVVQFDNASFQIQSGERVRAWFGIPGDLPNVHLIKLTPG